MEKLLGREDLGEKKRREIYPDLYSQGYSFDANVSIKPLNPEFSPERIRRSRELKGLDVVIVERAFWLNGREDPNLRTLFSKKREYPTHSYIA